MVEFRMPSLGADMDAGTLVAWRKKPGDLLARGDVIGEVETDKGVIEVEVYTSGILERYLVEPGTKVPVGTPLALLREADAPEAPAHAATAMGAAPSAPPDTASVPPAAPLAPPVSAAPLAPPVSAPSMAPPVLASPSARRRARELGLDATAWRGTTLPPTRRDIEQAARPAVLRPAPGTRPRTSPAARRLAETLHVDLGALRGSGPDGAIALRDVERAAATVGSVDAQPGAPRQPTAAQGASAQQAMRNAIASAMARAKREIPHYYLATTIDLERAFAWLADRNATHGVHARILPAALLLKAVAAATRRMPAFNTRFEDGKATVPDAVHVGVAIALRGGGLVAPALHDADRTPLDALMVHLQDLVERARAGTVRSSELIDATITVTNLGERGVEAVFPIIHAPQTAMVGFGRVAPRPWVVDGTLAVRWLVQATLAADHRVTDGHLGARFLNLIDQLLQQPEAL